MLLAKTQTGCIGKAAWIHQNFPSYMVTATLRYALVVKKEYLRDFRAVADYSKSVHDHITGRRCNKCGSELRDTIINFSESLPQKPLRDGFAQSEEADLCLVLGSSLTVSPACNMPGRVAEKGKKLVICNLQLTPYDSIAAMKVHAKVDDLMTLVMKELELEIPSWKLHRRVEVKYKHVYSVGLEGEHYVLSVQGIDWEGIHASILDKVDVNINKDVKTMASEPFVLRSSEPFKEDTKITLHFMGHYAEPALDLQLRKDDYGKRVYGLDYDPYTRTWEYTAESRQSK